jgi:hypothetical protein
VQPRDLGFLVWSDLMVAESWFADVPLATLFMQDFSSSSGHTGFRWDTQDFDPFLAGYSLG